MIDATLQRLVQQAIERAVSLWPELSPVAHEVELSSEENPCGPEELEHHGHELFLARACALGEPAAIRVLEREYLGEIDKVAARVNGSPDFVDEVRQGLRERLLLGTSPRIGTYAGTGPLAAWLRVAALRLGLNLSKATRNREAILIDALQEPGLNRSLENEPYRLAVEAGLRQAFGALSPRERNLLRLHHIELVNIDQIGLMYSVHRATIARWLKAARQRIIDQVSDHLRQELRLTDSEVQSALFNVRSELEISVQLLLGRSGDQERSA